MIRMKRHVLFIALSAVALAACKKEAPPESQTDAAAEAIAESAPSAVVGEVDHSTPAGENAGFDYKAFAGTYSGTVPCADCPGIETSIAFSPDGKYTQTRVYQERGDTSASEGTWQLDADGKRILLDPTGKEDADTWVEVISGTEVRMLDAEDKRNANDHNYSLKRS